MTRNREQDVIDAIDALVDEQMAGGEHAHRQRAQAAGTGDRCALCGGAWHGEPWTGVDHEHLGRYDQHHHGRTLGCPGANATGPQRIRWRHEDRGARWLAQHGFRTGGNPFVDQTASVAWTIDMVNAMRPPVPPWQQRVRQLNVLRVPPHSPYVGPELHEGARIAVQLADGSLVTGTIGRYDENQETGEVEMTIVQHLAEYGLGYSALDHVAIDEPRELLPGRADPAPPSI
ncbi:hypothetical protein [Mycobacteroides abscessus]|uniref:hypothetical protein n=1 Tax=Mycobacteroides abscessus TaxID=36809 RepID=UPI0009A74A2B|nr:hypothetical protein [Mycobacteroides abscessus]